MGPIPPRERPAVLTEDERWLLLAMGGWMILDALLSKQGAEYLAQSHWGGTLRDVEGGPDWLRGGFSTNGGKVHCPAFGTPILTIKVTRITAYGLTLPADLRAEMEQCRKDSQALNLKQYSWCHCPWKHEAASKYSEPCKRYHPTDAEDDAARAEHWRIFDLEKVLLRRAFQMQEEPVGQLALFD